MTADHYTYRVTWSAEDGEYVGLCAEFPSLSWLGPTQEAAFGGIRALVAEVVEDMLGSHETPPEPMADRTAGQPDRYRQLRSVVYMSRADCIVKCA